MAIGRVKGLAGSLNIPPVGFVWKSASPTSPASIYSGTTWSVIKDRAIIGAGGNYANGLTGGRTMVTLTTNEMPSHSHSGSTSTDGSHTHTASVYTSSGGYRSNPSVYGFCETTVTTSSAGNHSHNASMSNAGSGESFSILNPYIVRYMWERVG